MPHLSLQRFSAGVFSAGWRFLAACRRRIGSRPRVAAWLGLKGDVSAETSYRAYNGRMFADFHEQERMLADQRRMAFYHAAIARHVQPGDRVVDLGTGTGILAAWAARRGAAQVYAIDHSEIITQARSVAAANGIRNVAFVAAHSSAFTVDEPVDVILHEQMGDCLFDEGMVANVTELRDRVLKPGGLIVPSRFEFFCEPIKVRDGRVVPFIWELDVHGYDYASLEWHRPQTPGYYRLASGDPTLIEHFLGVPEPALTFDLQTITPAGLPRAITFTRTVVNAGRFDGYAVFFRARVDGDLTLTTDPLDPERAPHWGYRILRVDRAEFAAGDEIDVTLTIGSWDDPDTWRWRQVKRAAPEPTPCGA